MLASTLSIIILCLSGAPLRPDSPALYSSTKAQAERLVLDANRDGLETVVVRPRFVWGRGDTTLLPTMVELVRSGRFAWVGGGEHLTSITHVDNAVEGLVLGATRGRPGNPYADIDVPVAGAACLDYEGELVAVIGTRARNVDAGDAMSHVAGLTVFNDVTMRDYQWRSVQWFAGKTWERSTPFGPAVVTLDELGDVDARELVVTVNDEERQRARLGDLVFGVADLVEDISRIVTLEPGDLIATGTPGGVGDAMDPKGYLTDGDVVEVRIDGLGSVRNRITVRP